MNTKYDDEEVIRYIVEVEIWLRGGSERDRVE